MSDRTTAGLNLLLLNLSYSEDDGAKSMSLDRIGGTAYLKKNFGDYIVFGGRFTYLNDSISDSLGGGASLNGSKSEYIFGWETAIIF